MTDINLTFVTPRDHDAAWFAAELAHRVRTMSMCVKSPLPRGESNWEHRWVCSGLDCDCPECTETGEASK
jgi:hypothetical protein